MRLISSESVTEGHPDKLCDQISDSILDAILAKDSAARVAVESIATTGLVHIVGEVTTSSYVEIPAIVREVICQVGYDSHEASFDGNSCGVSVSLGSQSPDISEGVNFSLEHRTGTAKDEYDQQGAGDQGIMFGFASNETKELMPQPIALAHRLAEQLAKVRKNDTLPFLLPDGKTQVTIGYEGYTPKSLEAVVLSTQHKSGVSDLELSTAIKQYVIDPVVSMYELDIHDYQLLINPSGKFLIGGPAADAGLTGRKIIVDTYGGASRHGGGAFSGKDPSKVDRSAAYAMRWVAKNAVAAGFAERLELQVAYAIGKAHPVGIYVETFGTEKLPVERILTAIREVFDLRPKAIIRDLDLLRPIFAKTASYGHFGRELPEFSWEKLNRVDELRQAAKL